MTTFSEWLTERLNEDAAQFVSLLNNVRLGLSNELANASPRRGLVIDFNSYLQMIQQAAKMPEGQRYADILDQAYQQLQTLSMEFAHVLRNYDPDSANNYEVRAHFNQAIQPIEAKIMRVLGPIKSIMQNAA